MSDGRRPGDPTAEELFKGACRWWARRSDEQPCAALSVVAFADDRHGAYVTLRNANGGMLGRYWWEGWSGRMRFVPQRRQHVIECQFCGRPSDYEVTCFCCGKHVADSCMGCACLGDKPSEVRCPVCLKLVDAARAGRAALLTADEFETTFRPVENAEDGTWFWDYSDGPELDYVKQQPDGCVWTYCDTDGTSYISSGWHF